MKFSAGYQKKFPEEAYLHATLETNEGHSRGWALQYGEKVEDHLKIVSKLEKSKDKPIIVVCAMGVSAKKTASQLLKAGLEKVTVLKGGMNAWQSASLPVAK